jgi:hypothetical protein
VGSFAASVDLPDHLRPWRAAGLDALFLPDGLPAELPASQPEAAQHGRLTPATTLSSDHAATTAPVGPGQAPSPALPIPALDRDWPEPWRAIATRLRSRPQIIITYASLTADVTGAADPARRKLFLAILGYMGWPQGTSLFWPCTDVAPLPGVSGAPGTPSASGLARNIFLNGALSFGVTHIACFGPEAAHIATALFPPGAGDPEVRVLTLPAPEALIGLLPHELHRAVAPLKALTLE